MFPSTTLPVVPEPAISTPFSVLPLMRLPAPVPGVLVRPPIVSAVAPASISTPVALATATVPVASVPISSPSTTLPVVPEPVISTPSPTLPEITLPAPGAVPPIVLPEDPTITPSRLLPSAAVPAASVPMRFPSTVMPLEALVMLTPYVPLPEITLAEPAAVPPIVSDEAFVMRMPSSVLPSATAPAASVPIRLPSTTSPVAPAPVISMPRKLPLMTLPAPAAVPPIVLPARLDVDPGVGDVAQDVLAGRIGADQVALDQVAGRR